MDKRHPMVRWYNPILLIRIGIRAALATVVGKFSDNREIQAALDQVNNDPLYGAYDYSDPQLDKDFYLDYVADLGEGWDATFSVASAIAKPQLDIEEEILPRADLLIMGGDQIYPDPSDTSYQERMIDPYQKACESTESFDANLFALPGNHDWYDGLVAFTNIFCRARSKSRNDEKRRIGSWLSCQTRSYFAIKLPNNWWLCGVDVQLGSNANITQIDYFSNIANNLFKQGDRIILCSARPEWIWAEINKEQTKQSFAEIMDVLSVNDAQVKVVLAGDIHHYNYYKSDANDIHFITAGGGGAFLHPTHHLPSILNADGKNESYPALKLMNSFPDKKTSSKLTTKNFFFPFLNWDFSLLIGCVYTLLAWFFEAKTVSLGAPMSQQFLAISKNQGQISETIAQFFTTIPQSPEFAFIVFLLYFGFVKFNLTKQKILSFSLGIAHAMAHFVPFIVAYFAASLAAYSVGAPLSGEFIPFIIFITVTFVISSVLGGFVFGSYLGLALNWFGLHWNNAFSSLRIGDYCNFLRMQFNDDGKLTIYAIEIEKIGHTNRDGKWEPGSKPKIIETITIE